MRRLMKLAQLTVFWLAPRLVVWKRRLCRQCLWHGPGCTPAMHAPPRTCQWCGGPLPENAEAGQKFCKPGHREASRKQRGKPSRQLKQAWTLHNDYQAHAASCARKTASGGAYDSFGDALQALRWLREDTGMQGGSVYRCLVCTKFHITSRKHERKTA